MTDRAEGEAEAIRGSLDGVHDTTHEMDRGVLPTGELPALIRTESTSKPRIRSPASPPSMWIVSMLLPVGIPTAAPCKHS